MDISHKQSVVVTQIDASNYGRRGIAHTMGYSDRYCLVEFPNGNRVRMLRENVRPVLATFPDNDKAQFEIGDRVRVVGEACRTVGMEGTVEAVGIGHNIYSHGKNVGVRLDNDAFLRMAPSSLASVDRVIASDDDATEGVRAIKNNVSSSWPKIILIGKSDLLDYDVAEMSVTEAVEKFVMTAHAVESESEFRSMVEDILVNWHNTVVGIIDNKTFMATLDVVFSGIDFKGE